MELLTSPNFPRTTRKYSYSEVQKLLCIPHDVMAKLTTDSILCKEHIMKVGKRNREAVFHSALDILAAHLYLNVAVESEGRPTRQMISVIAVKACERELQYIEMSQPPASKEEIETLLNKDKILIQSEMTKYCERLATEILRFWKVLHAHVCWIRN